jgi:hypothetical protein
MVDFIMKSSWAVMCVRKVYPGCCGLSLLTPFCVTQGPVMLQLNVIAHLSLSNIHLEQQKKLTDDFTECCIHAKQLCVGLVLIVCMCDSLEFCWTFSAVCWTEITLI